MALINNESQHPQPSCWPYISRSMMTSSKGNIFRVTGPLCGEFTGPGEFPTQRPVTRSFDAFFDLRLNKRLSKQWWGWWFETPSWPLWRQCNDLTSVPYNYSFIVNIMPGAKSEYHANSGMPGRHYKSKLVMSTCHRLAWHSQFIPSNFFESSKTNLPTFPRNDEK